MADRGMSSTEFDAAYTPFGSVGAPKKGSPARVVKWKGHKQWHYGVVAGEATSETEGGPFTDVEYTHSVPPSNQPSGRKVRMYGVHKLMEVGGGSEVFHDRRDEGRR